MNRRLYNFIINHSAAGELLPLLHATNAFSFDQICDSSRIEANDCSVFNKKLLYFFYGRAAYRTAQGRIGYQSKWSWPIVFIFEPNALRRIEAIYPFDTGAFYKRMYRAFFDDRQKLEDFYIGNDIDNASQCVSAFYRNNEEYIRNYSTKNIDIDEQDFYAGGVAALLRANQLEAPDNPSGRDERSTSIEISTDESIDLLSKRVLAIILPQTYIGLERVQLCLGKWNPKYIRFYETHNMQSYEFWHGQIHVHIKNIYLQEGIINEK